MQSESPVSKTKVDISLSDYFRLNIRQGFHLRLMLLTGRIADYIEKSRAIYEVYLRKTTLRNSSGRPDSVEMKELLAPRMNAFAQAAHLPRSRVLSDDEVLDADFRKSDGYQSATAFLHRFLTKHPSEIKTVVNVGCGLDNICEWLARKHPDVQFISNDTMEDTEDMHRILLPSYSESSNWKCVAGYQHDLIREQKLKGDLFFSKSTAAGFFPNEIDAYIALLSKTAKYVYFLEGWAQPLNLNIFKLVKPENVDPDKAFLSAGGYFFHNFFALFNKHGFDVITAELYTGVRYTLHIMAKNRNL